MGFARLTQVIELKNSLKTDRVTRKVKAVDRLRQGQHPITGIALPSKSRRMCKRDVGDSLWSGEGRPSDPMHTDHDTDDGDAATVQAGMILSTDLQSLSLFEEDDDPLGLGLHID